MCLDLVCCVCVCGVFVCGVCCVLCGDGGVDGDGDGADDDDGDGVVKRRRRGERRESVTQRRQVHVHGQRPPPPNTHHDHHTPPTHPSAPCQRPTSNRHTPHVARRMEHRCRRDHQTTVTFHDGSFMLLNKIT